jgi:hypothetical protein
VVDVDREGARARLRGGDEVEEEDAVGTPRESDDDRCVGGEADGARELQPARRGERAGVPFRRAGSAGIRRKGERGVSLHGVVFAARLRGKAAPVRGGGPGRIALAGVRPLARAERGISVRERGRSLVDAIGAGR